MDLLQSMEISLCLIQVSRMSSFTSAVNLIWTEINVHDVLGIDISPRGYHCCCTVGSNMIVSMEFVEVTIKNV